jgi:GAF domain-containing protein
MKERRRASIFRVADWSFATKATIVPTVGLVLITLVLAFLVTQTIREIQLESLEADFELLGESESRRVTQAVVRQVALVNALAQSQVIIEHAQHHHNLGVPGAVPPNHAAGSAEVGRQVDLFMRRFPEYRQVVVVDEHGTLIDSSTGSPGLDYSEAVWVSVATSGTSGRVFLSDDRAIMPEEGAQGLEIALPVLNEADELVGAVFAVWDLSTMADTTAAGISADRVMVINEDAVVVIDSVPDTIGQVVLSQDMINEVNANVIGSAVGLDESGDQTVFGHSSLAGLTGIPEFEQTYAFEFDMAGPVRALGWTVVVSQDVESALVAGDVLTQRILILLAIGMMVIVISVFIFSRTLIAPLGRLTEAARRIGVGELDAPIPELGRDEVGQLAEVLRGTVAQLIERVEQLRSATTVARAAQTTLDIDQMLHSVTATIQQRFVFNQVRIYLLDSDGKNLTLRAVSGEGDDLPDKGQRIPADARGVIAEAASLGRPQVGSSRVRPSSEGGSELTVPLRIADEILGVLYVIVSGLNAFDAEDINVMELLADQIGTSVQNARLFEQSEANLRYIEALNRRLTREGWVDTIETVGELRYALGDTDGDEAWPEGLTQVARSGSVVVESQTGEADEAVLAVPISLRGEVIGTLGVKRPAGYQWSDDEISLMQAVGERVALIAEDIRLLEQADRTAQREQTVSDVSAKLQRTTELDSLLQVALSELSGVLGSDNISLRLGSPPDEKDEESADDEVER